MLAKLRNNWADLSVVTGIAFVVFFAFSLDQRAAETQEFDEAWARRDQLETASLVSLIEEGLTGQGIIIGRLDGSGGELLYQIGYRDGQTACR